MLRKWRFYGIALLCIFMLGCRQDLVHDLGDHDATRIATQLQEKNVSCERIRQSDGKWTIRVHEKEIMSALQILSQSRAFREKREIREESSVLPSEFEQRFRYERSLSSSLEDSLLTLNGVQEARVHLQMGKDNAAPLLGEIKNSSGTASVLLITSTESGVTIDEVSQLVSGGSGISRDKISVVVKHEEVPTTPASEPPLETKDPISHEATKLILVCGVVCTLLGLLLMKKILFREKRWTQPSLT